MVYQLVIVLPIVFKAKNRFVGAGPNMILATKTGGQAMQEHFHYLNCKCPPMVRWFLKVNGEKERD